MRMRGIGPLSEDVLEELESVDSVDVEVAAVSDVDAFSVAVDSVAAVFVLSSMGWD